MYDANEKMLVSRTTSTVKAHTTREIVLKPTERIVGIRSAKHRMDNEAWHEDLSLIISEPI